MGNMVSELRDQAEKASGNDKMEASALEALKVLETMAGIELEAFYQKIENSAQDAKKIPINQVLTKYHFIRAVTQKGDAIGPKIKECVKTFATGPVSDGLTDLAANVFGTLLGSSKGQRLREERYTVRINKIMGVSRLDMLFFAYNFESESIVKTCSSVLACCVVESSAELKDVNDNTVRVLVGTSFASSPEMVQHLIYSEIYWEVLRKRKPEPLTEDEKNEHKDHKAALKTYREAGGAGEGKT